MYTYCDKGGAVAAVVLGYYVEGGLGGYDFSGQLPQELGRVLPALCYTAELPPPLLLKRRRPTWFVAQ